MPAHADIPNVAPPPAEGHDHALQASPFATDGIASGLAGVVATHRLDAGNMTVQARLDQLRQSSYGCMLTAYGDISSGLILRSSSETPCPREVLDTLCEDAIKGFALADHDARSIGADSSVYGAMVISFTAERSHVFVRQDAATNDVICAVLEKSQAIDPVLRAARAAARKISEDAR